MDAIYKVKIQQLKRNIKSVGAGTSEEEREGDGEGEEVEGDVSLQHLLSLPLYIKLHEGKDGEDERRHLGPETDDEQKPASYLHECIERDEEGWGVEVKSSERGEPPAFLWAEFEKAKIYEDKSQKHSQDKRGEQSVV